MLTDSYANDPEMAALMRKAQEKLESEYLKAVDNGQIFDLVSDALEVEEFPEMDSAKTAVSSKRKRDAPQVDVKKIMRRHQNATRSMHEAINRFDAAKLAAIISISNAQTECAAVKLAENAWRIADAELMEYLKCHDHQMLAGVDLEVGA